jgi:hypothetical protein
MDLGSGRGHWQRWSLGTPASACSTCAPQPDHVTFAHVRHVTLWHIVPPPLRPQGPLSQSTSDTSNDHMRVISP